MKVPVHVLPVGDEHVGGDVAIVSVVAPNQVRKFSKVAAQVFVRSYGYKGKRSELKIVTGESRRQAARPSSPAYRSSFKMAWPATRLFLSRATRTGISRRGSIRNRTRCRRSNNAFGADLAIDHTKIRVLYIEGATDRYAAQRGQAGPQGTEVRGAYSSLQEALMEDPDVECTAMIPGGVGGDFSTVIRHQRERAQASRNPIGMVRLRRTDSEQRPSRCLERSATRLGRGVGRPARGRAVHGRRSQQLRLRPLE